MMRQMFETFRYVAAKRRHTPALRSDR